MGIKIRQSGQWVEVAAGSGGSDPVGTIVIWAGSAASIPTDQYQLCDGSAASTSALQAITGANVPDLRDRFIVGASDSTGDNTYPGLSPNATPGGSANATLVSHNHGSGTLSGSTKSLITATKVFQYGGDAVGAHGYSNSSTTISGSTSYAGSSATNANLPPYYALCYIIKHTVTSGGGGGSGSGGGGTSTTKIAILQDKKSSGTNGGTFTSGAWQDRILNTEIDPESIVGGASGIFTLQAGTYRINWSAPAHAVDSHQSKLLYADNISFTSSSEVLGSSEACHDPILEGNNNIQTRSFGETILTLTQATFLKIQHRCTGTKSNTGFGVPSNFGVDEVYTQVVIQDLGSSGGGGKVVQVIQSTKTDTASVTGSTFGDVGLSASITPSSATNKILVLVQANIGASAGYDMKTRLMRGNTPIHIGGADGNRPRVTTTITQTYGSTVNYNADQANINYLDSPNTTNPVTYKIQMASYDSQVVYINRNGADLNTTQYDGRGASSIILMEVSA
tara:strand:+ start:1007 stop:2530 length:1524 start_codon:yes stop_codon:yes gene_type:complete